MEEVGSGRVGLYAEVQGALRDELRSYCASMGLAQREVVERAVRAYLVQQGRLGLASVEVRCVSGLPVAGGGGRVSTTFA
jgi:hypothetical protein